MINIFKKTLLVFCGIISAFITIEIMMQISGFIIFKYKDYKNEKVFKKEARYTIICIGDSMTYNQYPVQLQQMLDKKYPGLFAVIDCGKPGLHGDVSQQEIVNRSIKKYKPDIAICMLRMDIKLFEDTSLFLKLKKLKLYKQFNSILFFKKTGYEVNKSIYKDDIKQKFQRVYYYKDRKEFTKAVNIIRKILDAEPDNVEAQEFLSFLYVEEKSSTEEIYKIAKKIINSHAKNKLIWYKLIFQINFDFKKLDDLRFYADKAINDNPEIFSNASEAYELYGFIKDVLSEPQKEKILKLINNNRSDRFYGFKAIYYMEKKEYEKADMYFEKADKIRYKKALDPSGERIIKKLIDSNVKVVFMQYPLRSIESLKKIFRSKDWYDELIFISNEYNFKQALKRKKYTDIFYDQFAGDYGHCLGFGNTMIADNVVKTLEDLLKLKINNNINDNKIY